MPMPKAMVATMTRPSSRRKRCWLAARVAASSPAWYGSAAMPLATRNSAVFSTEARDRHDRIYIYARGSGSDLTIDSSISTNNDLRLYSGGDVSIGGTLNTTNFSSFSAGNFVVDSAGLVTAGGIFVTSQNGSIEFNTDGLSAENFSEVSLSLTAGGAVNITMGTDLSVFESASSISVSGAEINLITGAGTVILNLNVTSPATFTAGSGGINASNIDFMTTGGLELRSGGDISVYEAEIPFVNNGRGISGVIDAAGQITAVANITSGDVTAGTSISVGGDLFVVNATAGTTINVDGELTAFGTVTAGGDITANRTAVPTISSPNGVLQVGESGIHPFVESFGPGDGADVQHTITIDSIISNGGIDFNGDQFGGISDLSHGGLLTINARTILFDPAEGIAFANFDGADMGAFNGVDPEAAGSGGTLIVNTTGDITMTSDSYITATTGLQDPMADFSGAGGNVTLDSSDGMISIDSLIQVSSDDNRDTNFPIHASASGGNITLHSGLTSGQAITLTENSQLLSLLNDSAPGPGGTISILTDGGDITANGQIEADRGTIIISNMGMGMIHIPGGATSPISLDGGTLTADTVEIGSLGDLNIGLNNDEEIDALTLSISAGNILHLGNFVSLGTANTASGNVTLSAAGIIVDDTLNIQRMSGEFADGINIYISADNDISVANAVQLVTDNSAGMLGTGGNITVIAGGDFTAASMAVAANNMDGGQLDSGGNILFGITGNLTTTGNASFQIGNGISDSGSVGGQIGGDAAININAGDITAGIFSCTIDNTAGTIAGDAVAGFAAMGDVNTAATALAIYNSDTGAEGTPGSIGGQAIVNFTALGDLTTNVLVGYIDNQNGGSIGDRAAINVNLFGNSTIATDATFEIDGSDGADSATIAINDGDFVAGGTFRTFIDGNGTIGFTSPVFTRMCSK